jgi:hypothetical protein
MTAGDGTAPVREGGGLDVTSLSRYPAELHRLDLAPLHAGGLVAAGRFGPV